MTDRDVSRGHRPAQDDWPAGPTGHAPGTESLGDPEEDDLGTGAQAGAAGGALVGTAIGGPMGLAVGGLVGAAAGATGEAADDDRPRTDTGGVTTEGTGPLDPALDPNADRDARRRLAERREAGR